MNVHFTAAETFVHAFRVQVPVTRNVIDLTKYPVKPKFIKAQNAILNCDYPG